MNKTPRLHLLAILLFMISSATFGAQANLLPNGSFERLSKGGGIPDGWTPYGGVATVVTGIYPKCGHHTLQLQDNSTNAGAGLYSSYAVVAPGNSYTAEAHVKRTDTGRNAASIYIKYYDRTGTQVGEVSRASKAAADVWDFVSVTGAAPTNAVKARVLCYSGGNATGTIYFDDVSFRQTPPTTSAIQFVKDDSSTNSYFPLWQPKPPNIADLALIYQGDSVRPQWTTNRFAPYVSYRDPQTSREQWLFDGFLFIEIQISNQVFQAVRVNKTHPAAQKSAWTALLEKHFATDDGIPSLEKTCREVRSRIGPPLRRRQIILTFPEPVPGQTNWGKINGRELNFHRSADRVAALNWYVETALQKWNELAPQHLELAGFYWGPESFPDFWKPETQRGTNFLPLVAAVVHARDKKFFWIPCWHKNWAQNQWRSLGFDVAWQQPNHFFHPEIPDTRLDEACAFARQCGMGLEFECNSRMISEPEKFERRFDAYLDAFIKHDVKQAAAIAYFSSVETLFQLANSTEARMRAHYDRIARFICDRQNLADEQFRRQP